WVVLRVSQWPRANRVKRSAATLPLRWLSSKLSARTGGRCRRTRETIAATSCAAMRKLVPGKVVPRPPAPKPRGLDLGSGPGTRAVKVMGSDLETGAVKGRAGDSNVAADGAMFESLLRIRDTGGDTEVGERHVPLDLVGRTTVFSVSPVGASPSTIRP